MRRTPIESSQQELCASRDIRIPVYRQLCPAAELTQRCQVVYRVENERLPSRDRAENRHGLGSGRIPVYFDRRALLRISADYIRTRRSLQSWTSRSVQSFLLAEAHHQNSRKAHLRRPVLAACRPIAIDRVQLRDTTRLTISTALHVILTPTPVLSDMTATNCLPVGSTVSVA
jgi:hypothetical protein